MTDVQYTSKCTGEMIINHTRLIQPKRVQIWLLKPCRTSANSVTERDPNEIPNDCNMATKAVRNKIPNDCSVATSAGPNEILMDSDMATELVPNEIEYDHRTY
jgi:hypothetical protein